jgi:hypothetical protein
MGLLSPYKEEIEKAHLLVGDFHYLSSYTWRPTRQNLGGDVGH